MPIIANTTSSNTVSAIRAQLNAVTKRINAFAGNESALYANTITANVSLRLSGTIVANGGVGTSGHYLRTSGTGVYWSPVAAGSSGATWAALLATNTAIRALDAQKISVTNAAAAYVAKSGSTMTGNLTLSSGALIKLSTSGQDARATGIQNASGLDLGYFDRSFTYFDDIASNCNGIIPNGNCLGNSTWVPPNTSWWTWGITGVTAGVYSNAAQFDFATTATNYGVASIAYNYDSYYLAVAEIGGDQYRRNYRNCNCNCNCAGYTSGPFNCRTNCNCNCNC